MARLDPKPYPVPELTGSTDFKAYAKEVDELLEKLKGRLYTYPVADGQAIYLVKSEEPLVLQHVPVWDGYMLPAAHIRGLKLSEIRNYLRAEEALERAFAKSKVAE